MKILTIGDLHGLDIWKKFIEEKADIYVFLGDYVDSFTVEDKPMISNLLNIIEFKKNNENVFLLWGNHDLQYIDSRMRCSGYRWRISYKLEQIYRENYDLFNPMIYIGNYVWSHAGIHQGWFDHQFKGTKIRDIIDAFNSDSNDALLDIGHYRGGTKPVGGIFWADKRMTSKKPLKGYHQIVGHHPVDEITTIYKNNNTSITYCDCLERGHSRRPYILDL